MNLLLFNMYMHILSIEVSVFLKVAFSSYVFLYRHSHWEGIGEFIVYSTQDEDLAKNYFILTVQNYFNFI